MPFARSSNRRHAPEGHHVVVDEHRSSRPVADLPTFTTTALSAAATLLRRSVRFHARRARLRRRQTQRRMHISEREAGGQQLFNKLRIQGGRGLGGRWRLRRRRLWRRRFWRRRLWRWWLWLRRLLLRRRRRRRWCGCRRRWRSRSLRRRRWIVRQRREARRGVAHVHRRCASSSIQWCGAEPLCQFWNEKQHAASDTRAQFYFYCCASPQVRLSNRAERLVFTSPSAPRFQGCALPSVSCKRSKRRARRLIRLLNSL